MRRGKTAQTLAGLPLAIALTVCMPAAHADVRISSAPTKNMSCANGVCAPTAKSAVLNVSDLTAMLATGNVDVTTGSGQLARQVKNIIVSAGFSWASASSLTLDAYESISFDKAVSVAGSGAVVLMTDDGGTGGALSFGSKGRLSFVSPTNSLTIDGNVYTLANSVSSLAAAIANNPFGYFALSTSYNAKPDGTYSASPIAMTFGGVFNGLGNTISNLSIRDQVRDSVGLFSMEGSTGTIASLRLQDVQIYAYYQSDAGGLVGEAAGALIGDTVSGIVKSRKTGSTIGGLAGNSVGTVSLCSATASVVSGDYGNVGGLVGGGDGTLSASWTSGPVSVGDNGHAGGLVGISSVNAISDSYATGPVMGGASAYVGGLIGENGDPHGDGANVATSYSTGAPAGGSGSSIGGLIGVDDASAGSLSNTYWDTTTSGITNLSQGAGNIANDPGITGDTTAQLQAGLPAGFDPTVWAENPNINGGLPYLIANPPQ